uniref:acid phosphatase n=1 Tax=Panagrellus redivivus TaxID=6233 RepID=A0A7E4UR76_PANRE
MALSKLIALASFATVVFAIPIHHKASTDELLFVQAVWRHGDRSPCETFKTDKYQEDFWPQGWGELSALGMAQHVDLGQTLRKRYIDELKFLKPEYDSHEIYVRSTDFNRTLISAMSNLIGMYPEGASIQAPTIPEWPRSASGKFWVPIPVHTLKDDIDHTLNPDHDCPRQADLWKKVKRSPEYKQLQHDEADFLSYLSKHTGMNVTPAYVENIADIIFIEKTNNLTLPDWVNAAWNKTVTVAERVVQINDIVEGYINGLGLSPINGTNMAIEIPKLRGGELLWSIIGHMQQKWACHQDPNSADCSYFNRLKYYAYSGHDTSIAALFGTLGFSRTNYNEDGYPHYSSCVTVELWRNAKTGKPYVKFLYLPLVKGRYHTEIEDITKDITGGPITDIDSLAKRSQIYKPVPNAMELCKTRL